MKVALVYDRVNKWGGAERLLLALHEMFPDAPIYTSVYSKKNAGWADCFPEIKTSFLQKLPFTKTKHELLGTFMPLAFESMSANGEFDEYDLVISLTSEAAKGIITKPRTKHLCICLTPTRYLWSHYEMYFENKLLKFFGSPAIWYLRQWDKIASQRPDKIISISSIVKRRVRKYYGLDSKVIFPPNLLSSRSQKHVLVVKPYYLVVSRLVKYKKVDLVVKAFKSSKRKLVVLGGGHQALSLKLFSSKNIKFINHVGDSDLISYYKNAKALIFPQEEDFGLVALEAMNFGIPVVAYNRGGAGDIVIPGLNGVFFDKQTPEALVKAIQKLEKSKFSSGKIVKHAKKFSKENFKEDLKREIGRLFQ